MTQSNACIKIVHPRGLLGQKVSRQQSNFSGQTTFSLLVVAETRIKHSNHFKHFFLSAGNLIRGWLIFSTVRFWIRREADWVRSRSKFEKRGFE